MHCSRLRVCFLSRHWVWSSRILESLLLVLLRRWIVKPNCVQIRLQSLLVNIVVSFCAISLAINGRETWTRNSFKCFHVWGIQWNYCFDEINESKAIQAQLGLCSKYTPWFFFVYIKKFIIFTLQNWTKISNVFVHHFVGKFKMAATGHRKSYNRYILGNKWYKNLTLESFYMFWSMMTPMQPLFWWT